MAVLKSSRGIAWALVDSETPLINFDGWYTPLPERIAPNEEDRRGWIADGYDYPSLVNWDSSFAHEIQVVTVWPLP